MRKLYENFHIVYFQKRIVSPETIRGNMVNNLLFSYNRNAITPKCCMYTDANISCPQAYFTS